MIDRKYKTIGKKSGKHFTMAGKGSKRRQEDTRKIRDRWPLTDRPIKDYHKRIRHPLSVLSHKVPR